MMSEGNEWVTVDLGQDVSLPLSFTHKLFP